MFVNGAFSNRQQAAEGDPDGTVLLSEESQDERAEGRMKGVSIVVQGNDDIKNLSNTPNIPLPKNQSISLLDDQKLLQLVSEHLIQSIQYLSFHACHNDSVPRAQSDTEGDIPEENAFINSTHSNAFQVPRLSQHRSLTFKPAENHSFSGSSECSSYISALDKLEKIAENDSSTFDSLEDLDEGEGDSLGWMTEQEASSGLSTSELQHNEITTLEGNTQVKIQSIQKEKRVSNSSNNNDGHANSTQEIKRSSSSLTKKRYPLINRINKDFSKKFLPNSISEIGRISPLFQPCDKRTSLPTKIFDAPLKTPSFQQDELKLQSHVILNLAAPPTFKNQDTTQNGANTPKNINEGSTNLKNIKKKSILSSSKQPSLISTPANVRFDQNIEFCDSNLDLLKKHKELPLPQFQQQQQLQKAQEAKKILIQGWLLKKSSNRILLNSYQKRYFVLSAEKLCYWSDERCLKELGCINLKHLACSVSLASNPTKLELRIPEMRKILKLQEINQGDISKWHKSISLAISYNAKHPKLYLNNRQLKQQYKRDLITEKDMRQTAKTGDIILFDPINDIRDTSQQRDVALLVKFNQNDLRVFASVNSQPPTLFHWETFLHNQKVFNQVLLRRLEISDRSQILPSLYESIRQQLHDNYKAKLKDAISAQQDDQNNPFTHHKDGYGESSKLKNIESSQRTSNSSINNNNNSLNQKDSKQLTNSQILGQIFQRAGLVKSSKKIDKFVPGLFGQNKQLKLLKEARLGNEITVILNRQIYLANQNNFD